MLLNVSYLKTRIYRTQNGTRGTLDLENCVLEVRKYVPWFHVAPGNILKEHKMNTKWHKRNVNDVHKRNGWMYVNESTSILRAVRLRMSVTVCL